MPLITKPIATGGGATSITPPAPPLARAGAPVPVAEYSPSAAAVAGTAPQSVTPAAALAKNKTLWE